MRDERVEFVLVLAPGDVVDARDDQARIRLPERLGCEAEMLERAGPEVLHEHIRIVDQAVRGRQIRRILEVQRDQALAPGLDRPPQQSSVVRNDLLDCLPRSAAAVGHSDATGGRLIGVLPAGVGPRVSSSHSMRPARSSTPPR
ncbi:hypothetical protein GCM10022240_03840 [Microbacterium kribbense]|uniref:Uncharacterized protein n=1 Tax=Microbacterium kribbense TaxID=433645 RepID=A0ABP7G3V2_9MICO